MITIKDHRTWDFGYATASPSGTVIGLLNNQNRMKMFKTSDGSTTHSALSALNMSSIEWITDNLIADISKDLLIIRSLDGSVIHSTQLPNIENILGVSGNTKFARWALLKCRYQPAGKTFVVTGSWSDTTQVKDHLLAWFSITNGHKFVFQSAKSVNSLTQGFSRTFHDANVLANGDVALGINQQSAWVTVSPDKDMKTIADDGDGSLLGHPCWFESNVVYSNYTLGKLVVAPQSSPHSPLRSWDIRPHHVDGCFKGKWRLVSTSINREAGAIKDFSLYLTEDSDNSIPVLLNTIKSDDANGLAPQIFNTPSGVCIAVKQKELGSWQTLLHPVPIKSIQDTKFPI